VYADDVGDTYNIQSGKLTLPGLKDKADMYAGITAEVISPISGGFVGERPVITNEEKTAAYEKLKETLASKSEGALSDKVPDKYIYIPRSMHLEYSEGREEYNNNTVTLTLDVTATAPIFVYTDFITLLTKLSKETTLSNSSTLNSVDSLSLAEIVTTKDDTTRKYTLSGTTTIVWGIDSADIRNNLAGVSRSAVTAIMSKYPGIARAEVSIRPLWISHLPTNPETIEIIIIDPAAEK
jgi:hypothetical protein